MEQNLTAAKFPEPSFPTANLFTANFLRTLFKIYTYDLPFMTSQMYAYADDLALLYATRDWKAVEDTLSQDMTILSAHPQT